MVNKVRVNIAGTPYAIATTDSEKYILVLVQQLCDVLVQLFGKTQDVLFRICGCDSIRCARDVDPYLVYHGVFPFFPVSVRRKAVCSASCRDLAPFPVTFRLPKTFRRSFLCHYCRNYSPKNVSRLSSAFYYNINTPQEKVEFLKFRHICQKVA